MSSVTSIALGGMSAAAKRMAVRAENLVNRQNQAFVPLAPVQAAEAIAPVVRTVTAPAVTLEEDMVDLRIFAMAYKASAALARTARRMDDALLDILS